MHAVEVDAERLLARVRRQPWRTVVAAEARRDPHRYAAVTGPGGAAPLALLPVAAGRRALVVGDGWGRLAVPLARRAAVAALLPSPAQAALLRCVAGQEGVRLFACAGDLAAPPFAAGGFDLVLLHGELAEQADLLTAAQLLAPAGVLYATATNPLAGGRLASADETLPTLAELRARTAEVGLSARREYACFPDAAGPRAIVPLDLVAEFLRTQPAGGLTLARSGIAEHFAPTFAFVLQRAD